jgi:hypothetical protein
MQLCIPRVDTYYTRDYIYSIINRLNWGRVVKLYETRPKNNTDYRCIMINIDWNDNNENGDLKTRLKNGSYINIVYDTLSPRFWRIMESNRPTK